MLEDYFNDIVERLVVSRAVSSFKISRKELTEDDGYIRIKCNLANGDILEFAEYIVIRKNKVSMETYSYHWQGKAGELLKRWDNVAHHKNVKTFPHHLHLPSEKVVGSTETNLKKVLTEIEKSLPEPLND